MPTAWARAGREFGRRNRRCKVPIAGREEGGNPQRLFLKLQPGPDPSWPRCSSAVRRNGVGADQLAICKGGVEGELENARCSLPPRHFPVVEGLVGRRSVEEIGAGRIAVRRRTRSPAALIIIRP
jgi:hypothetical protein